MQELISILSAHAARYPHMEPVDAVKLIFQNEFGGGHLVRDERSCLSYLRREYASTPHSSAVPLYEPIGNHVIRVNLAAVMPQDLEALGQEFLRCAARRRGDADSFREKLTVLRHLAARDVFSFRSDALDAYLATYAQAGFPPVSHSQAYRTAYHPAYRVIISP